MRSNRATGALIKKNAAYFPLPAPKVSVPDTSGNLMRGGTIIAVEGLAHCVVSSARDGEGILPSKDPWSRFRTNFRT